MVCRAAGILALVRRGCDYGNEPKEKRRCLLARLHREVDADRRPWKLRTSTHPSGTNGRTEARPTFARLRWRRLQIGEVAGAHRAGLEFGPEGDGAISIGTRGLGGGVAMEDDALGVGIDGGAAVNFAGEMKLGAGVLVVSAIHEASTF